MTDIPEDYQNSLRFAYAQWRSAQKRENSHAQNRDSTSNDYRIAVRETDDAYMLAYSLRTLLVEKYGEVVNELVSNIL